MLPIIHHPGYTAETPDGHRFPMAKFARLATMVMDQGMAPDGFIRPEPASAAMLGLAHEPTYVASVLDGTLDPRAVRKIGFPLTPSVVMRARLATAGTVLAGELALGTGIACNTAGGSHHAHAGFGAGFCVFNDVAVAARTLLAAGRIRRALVIDLDVHHGDGTAAIFADDPAVFTFSMHCDANWPMQRPPSDHDIALPAGLADEDYLSHLTRTLPDLITRVRPDIAFYVAGVDVHAADRLGHLALSDDGIRTRDRFVLQSLAGAGVATVTVLGGGYDTDPDRVAARHLITIDEALKLPVVPRPAGLSGLAARRQTAQV
jgi:acetoin utilization deacetylase AcuC-like enzyme